MRRRRVSASPDPTRRPAGFTLVEVIVALAIMVMIAATVTPSVVGALDRDRQDRGLAMLQTLAAAIDKFHLTSDVGQYPRQLSYLSQPIVSTDLNSCGSPFGSTRAGLWKGPYVTRIITTSGLPVFIGTAQNTLIRTAGPPTTLSIRVDGVRLADAEALDLLVDGTASSTAGTIRYGSAINGLVTLDYVIPISGC
jgi:prepilin-type N-terminal cleavage/methylation domain-containing protein